jgi:hypothetical protein
VRTDRDVVGFLKNLEGPVEAFEDRIALLQKMRDADALNNVVKFASLSGFIDMNRRHVFAPGLEIGIGDRALPITA